MLSFPAASISFIVSYKKKSIKMAFTFASGCCCLISLLISSTHHILQPGRGRVSVSKLSSHFQFKNH